MADPKLSVDDILEEIDHAKKSPSSDGPHSSMSEVNDIIEQILLEKKNKSLKESNETLNQREREMLEKEIKTQTKNIAKLYEKAKKEATKQEKKRIQAEIDAADLPPVEWEQSFSNLEKDIEPELHHEMKLTTVHPDQAVKLKQPIAHITQNLPNKDKIESYAKSAHLEHIKREAMNITSHFGGAGVDNEVEHSNVINIHSYRKLKQSRDERIGSFVLDNGEKKPEPPQGDVQLGFDEQEIPKAADVPTQSNKKSAYDPQIDSSYVMAEDPDYSFETDESRELLISLLNKKLTLSKISMVGMLLLAINAIILMFVSPTAQGQLSLGSIVIEPSLYLNINLYILIGASIFSFGVFKNSIMSFVSRTPSRDILYLASIIICAITNIMFILSPKSILEVGVNLFTPVLIVSLFFNSYSRYIVARKTCDNFDYIVENPDSLYSITFVDDDAVASDLSKGMVDFDANLAKNIKIGQFTKFVANSFSPDASDSFSSKTCFFLLPVALIIFTSAFLLTKNLYTSLTVLNAIMVCATTFVGGLITAFPIKDTSKITEKFADMSPSTEAIRQFENTNTVLIDAYDLFPKGTVKLQGIKTFSGKRIDNAIIDAASVLCQSKSTLSHVFMDVIANNDSLLKPVDSIIYEDLMGISAWVDDKRVLIGNRELMINHSIAVPKKDYETKYHELNQEIVYIATEGELCAAFILGITTKKGIYDAFCLLRRNGIKAIIKSVDATLTVERISNIFNCDSTSFKIIPSRLHRDYLNEHKDVKKHDYFIGNNGTFLGYIFSLVVAKRLSSCTTSGMVLNTFSIVTGILIITALLLFNKLMLITNIIMFVYLALFGIIYWINQKNTHI